MVTAGAPLPDPVWGFRQATPGTRSIKLPSGLTLTSANVTCPPTTSGSTTTQFSAVATNVSQRLVCNPAVPGNPLANQTSPTFSNPLHTTLKRVWDTTGETLTRTSRAGRVTTEVRDAQGRKKSFQVGALTPTVYTYDLAHPDQLLHVDRGDRRTEFTYRGVYESDPTQTTPENDAGFVKEVRDAIGITTEFTRDIYGRPKTVREAKAVVGQEGTTILNWDGNGNLKLLTPPDQPSHNLDYNAANLLQQYTPPVVAGIANSENGVFDYY